MMIQKITLWITQLTALLTAAECLERRRAKRASWLVPACAILVAGWMFTSQTGQNITVRRMSPRYQIVDIRTVIDIDTLYQNEPDGFNLYRETDFDSVDFAGWILRPNGEANKDSIITITGIAPAPPRGGTSVVRCFHTAAETSGVGACTAGQESTIGDTIFVGSYIMYDTAYIFHPFQDKLLWLQSNGFAATMWIDVTGSTPNRYQLRFQAGNWTQGIDSTTLVQAQEQNQPDSTIIVKGQWDKLELLFTWPTAGNPDGQVKLWHNDTLIVQVDSVGIDAGASTWGGSGNGVTMQSVWGGAGDPPIKDMPVYLAHLYISKPN